MHRLLEHDVQHSVGILGPAGLKLPGGRLPNDRSLEDVEF